MSATVTPVIGLIGGSGLYDIPGLEDREWRRVESPWGAPSDEILFGRLGGGGHVKVVLRDGKLAFDIEGDKRESGAPVIESPGKGHSPAPELAD